jgi:hypothetical protein
MAANAMAMYVGNCGLELGTAHDFQVRPSPPTIT